MPFKKNQLFKISRDVTIFSAAISLFVVIITVWLLSLSPSLSLSLGGSIRLEWGLLLAWLWTPSFVFVNAKVGIIRAIAHENNSWYIQWCMHNIPSIKERGVLYVTECRDWIHWRRCYMKLHSHCQSSCVISVITYPPERERERDSESAKVTMRTAVHWWAMAMIISTNVWKVNKRWDN